MQITYPITDYIKQSILISQGDMVVNGPTVPQKLASDTLGLYLKAQGVGGIPAYDALTLSDVGVKIAQGTRNAGGNESITGVGYKPSLVIFWSVDQITANLNWSIGVSISSIDRCLYMFDTVAGTDTHVTRSIYIRRDVSNILQGEIISLDASGFTISWTLTGVIDLEYTYLCLP